MGVARRARHDRHEVRLRHGTLRRLHRARRRRRHPFLHHPCRQHRHFRDHNDRGNRRDSGGRQDPGGLARPGGRSMRVLPIGPDHVCFGAAAAGPMSAFAKRSSRPRNRTGREADNDPRPHHFPIRRPGSLAISERSLPAQLLAGRSGRGRRPDAEPEPGVRKRRSRSGRRRWLRAQRFHPH